MWIIFVSGCTAAAVYQIADRVDFFYSLPINVNVKINYNQSLLFPAVTICNLNSFRVTAAAEHGRYALIEHMFSRSRNITQEDLIGYNATDLSLEELYRSLAHKKEYFIVSCRWNNNMCNETDFEMIFTDHGVCFIFNQSKREMKVYSSGVDSGLHLTLNVEQYEYLTGPYAAAGVKMLLHDPRESPSVHGLGQAIFTGAHAFVGVKRMEINNLPSPHGDCAHKELEHTTYYTTEECYTDCLVKLASRKCGCRNIYMPQHDGVPPVCTLSQYYECLLPLEKEFDEKLRHECVCPVSCELSIFDPALSYATVSNHLVDKLLTGPEASALRDKLCCALEVSTRLDYSKFNVFKSLVDKMHLALERLQTRIGHIVGSLETQMNGTSALYEQLRSAYDTKEWLYRFQIYTVENNFLRGREVMEEMTIQPIVNGFVEFAMLIRHRIRRLSEINVDAMGTVADELFELINDVLITRHKLIELAKRDVKELLNAYYNGAPIFEYEFEDMSPTHIPFIVPKPLLNYSMYRTSYIRNLAPRIIYDLAKMHSVLEIFLNINLGVHNNLPLNKTYLDDVCRMYYIACSRFLVSKSATSHQGLEYPLDVLTTRKADFEQLWDHFRNDVYETNLNLDSLTNTLTDILNKTVPKLRSILSPINMYINDDVGRLIGLSFLFISNDTIKSIRNIEDAFIGMETRGQALNHACDLLRKHTEGLWTAIIDDEDMLEYYNYTNNTDFLRNLTEVLAEWALKFDAMNNLDVRNQVHGTDEKFLQAFNKLAEYMDGLQRSTRLDSDFVRQNFLQLDIFYRQLGVKQVTQHKAYAIFALICDIGGAMGLFIGASMLTIVEVMDLFLAPLFTRRPAPG